MNNVLKIETNFNTNFNTNSNIREGSIIRENFIKTFKEQNYDIFSCGFHKHGVNTTSENLRDIPNNFYRDFGLQISYRTEYFYIPKTEHCIEIYDKLKSFNKPFIFVHDTSSYMRISIGKELKEEKKR